MDSWLTCSQLHLISTLESRQSKADAIRAIPVWTFPSLSVCLCLTFHFSVAISGFSSCYPIMHNYLIVYSHVPWVVYSVDLLHTILWKVPQCIAMYLRIPERSIVYIIFKIYCLKSTTAGPHRSRVWGSFTSLDYCLCEFLPISTCISSKFFGFLPCLLNKSVDGVHPVTSA